MKHNAFMLIYSTICPPINSLNIVASNTFPSNIPTVKCHNKGNFAMSENLGTRRQRPTWDEYFLDIAFSVAERSTCDRAHVGAVLVRDRRILATGYNGSPAGLPHCDEVGHLLIDGHCVRTLHAEQNAI